MMEIVAVWQAWGNLLTAWDTLRLMLPNRLAREVAEMDVRISALRREMERDRAKTRDDLCRMEAGISELTVRMDAMARQSTSNGKGSKPLSSRADKCESEHERICRLATEMSQRDDIPFLVAFRRSWQEDIRAKPRKTLRDHSLLQALQNEEIQSEEDLKRVL